METIFLTQEEFDLIETNRSGIQARNGLVVKKQSMDNWYLLRYGECDEKGNYDIDVKLIKIK